MQDEDTSFSTSQINILSSARPSSSFITIDPHDAKPPSFAALPRIYEWIETIRDQRMIVFAGKSLRDKADLARHLAWFLAHDSGWQNAQDGSSAIVKQWLPTHHPQQLDIDLRQAGNDAATVFVLVDLEPRHCHRDLGTIKDALNSNCVAIVTTEEATTAWSPRPSRVGFQVLETNDVFPLAYLTTGLVDRLNTVNDRLPEGIQQRPWSDTSEIHEQRLTDLARQLGTRSAIARFVDALHVKIEAEEFGDLIKSLNGEESAVTRRYRSRERPLQAFATVLALFDGLVDDQAFALIEHLLDTCWQKTGFNRFDYGDLATLSGLVEVGDFVRVDHRDQLIELGWESHRRHVLAILPVLVELVRISAELWPEDMPNEDLQPDRDVDEPKDPETLGPDDKPTVSRWHRSLERDGDLFGSPERCTRLRYTASRALGSLASLGWSYVERALLELARSPHYSVQLVAARTIAVYVTTTCRTDSARESTPKRIAGILKGWQREAYYETDSRAETDNIRKTVALALAEMGLRLSEFPRAFETLLTPLMHDRSQAVRAYGKTYTLPLVLSQHAKSLDVYLQKEVLSVQYWIHSVAYGLVLAYKNQPDDVATIITNWYRQARNQPAGHRLGAREHMLATVALVCGQVGESDNEPLTKSWIMTIFDHLLEENSSFISHHVIQALAMRVRHQARAFPEIAEHMNKISLSERKTLINTFRSIYLEQRRAMRGGDKRQRVGKFVYDVWFRHRRPRTQIETYLDRWTLTDEESVKPATRQLAIATSMVFSNTRVDQIERELRQAPPTESTLLEATSDDVDTPRELDRVTVRGLDLAGQLALWLVVRDRHARQLLQTILPEILIERNSQESIHRRSVIGSRIGRVTTAMLATIFMLFAWPFNRRKNHIRSLFRRCRGWATDLVSSLVGFWTHLHGFVRANSNGPRPVRTRDPIVDGFLSRWDDHANPQLRSLANQIERVLHAYDLRQPITAVSMVALLLGGVSLLAWLT